MDDPPLPVVLAAAFGLVAIVLLKLRATDAAEVALLVGVFALALLMHPVSVLVHELGHALAVVVLARRPAYIVIGDSEAPARRFRLGPIGFHLSRGDQAWCLFVSEGVGRGRMMVILVAGVAANLVLAAILVAAAFAVYPASTVLCVGLLVAALASTYDLVNLVPMAIPGVVGEGSDGRQLVRTALTRRRRGSA